MVAHGKRICSGSRRGHGSGREEERKGAVLMVATRTLDGGKRVGCGGRKIKVKEKIGGSFSSREKMEIIHDVSNFNLKNQCILDNQSKLNLESQQEFGSGDGNKLNITKVVFDSINIDIDVVVDGAIITNLELKLILNESVDEPIQFLTITEEVPSKEINEFFTFSFEEEDKARVTKASCNIEGRKLKLIIP
ncbi:hypothetical protein PVK06_027313 [Gossypium arboreum]|uniref:Uncharacterized protein n=1 Tax=Gossypium arboreum TaxID=29729 RepID=A0ABR0NZX7_GOSAR|nr:hypothetical protein PVK06_027313 [Gossypium arboreum]